MKFESKFNTGDMVYGNHITKSKRKAVNCKVCGGTHEVKIEGMDKFTYCPECNFDGHIWIDEPCCTAHPFSGRVGKIGIEYYGGEEFVPESYRGRPVRITYMLDDSGIGSGTVRDEDTMFATREEADKLFEKTEAEWVATQAMSIQEGGKK